MSVDTHTGSVSRFENVFAATLQYSRQVLGPKYSVVTHKLRRRRSVDVHSTGTSPLKKNDAKRITLAISQRSLKCGLNHTDRIGGAGNERSANDAKDTRKLRRSISCLRPRAMHSSLPCSFAVVILSSSSRRSLPRPAWRLLSSGWLRYMRPRTRRCRLCVNIRHWSINLPRCPRNTRSMFLSNCYTVVNQHIQHRDRYRILVGDPNKTTWIDVYFLAFPRGKSR